MLSVSYPKAVDTIHEFSYCQFTRLKRDEPVTQCTQVFICSFSNLSELIELELNFRWLFI